MVSGAHCAGQRRRAALHASLRSDSLPRTPTRAYPRALGSSDARRGQRRLSRKTPAMLFALLVLAVLAAASVIAWRRHGRAGLKLALFLSAVCVGIAGCARPFVAPWHALVLILA